MGKSKIGGFRMIREILKAFNITFWIMTMLLLVLAMVIMVALLIDGPTTKVIGTEYALRIHL